MPFKHVLFVHVLATGSFPAETIVVQCCIALHYRQSEAMSASAAHREYQPLPKGRFLHHRCPFRHHHGGLPLLSTSLHQTPCRCVFAATSLSIPLCQYLFVASSNLLDGATRSSVRWALRDLALTAAAEAMSYHIPLLASTAMAYEVRPAWTRREALSDFDTLADHGERYGWLLARSR